MLNKFAFFHFAWLLDNLLTHYFKGLVITFRALNRMQVACIFFNLNEPGFFIFPHIIVNGVKILFCLHAFIQVNIFLFFAQQFHGLTCFWRNPRHIAQNLKALFDEEGIVDFQQVLYNQGYDNAHHDGKEAPYEVHDRRDFHDISIEIKTQLTGNYNLENVLAAVAIGAEWNIAPNKITEAIESYTPSNQRSQIIKKNNITIVLDAYNANPTSVEAALKNFETSFTGKKMVVLGDMLELGKESEQEHFHIGTLLNTMKLNEVILVGENFKTVAAQFHFQHFNDSIAATGYFSKMKNETFTLLIKGSRGVKTEKILEAFEK